MQTLKELAQEGCTVIASIHQPRSSIFLLFDDLMLVHFIRRIFRSSPHFHFLPNPVP